MTNELKTCPWCDHLPVIEPWHGGGPQKRRVSCDNEACPVEPSVTGPTKAKAIAAWNRRAAPPPAAPQPAHFSDSERRTLKHLRAVARKDQRVLVPDAGDLAANALALIKRLSEAPQPASVPPDLRSHLQRAEYCLEALNAPGMALDSIKLALASVPDAAQPDLMAVGRALPQHEASVSRSSRPPVPLTTEGENK